MAGKFDLYRSIYSRPFSARTGPASSRPIFIVGMMRSGTTLLEQILSAHADVVGAGELDFWPGSEVLMIDSSRGELRPGAVAERREAYSRLLTTLAGESARVVDKNPANLVAAGLIHEAFPDSPIINLRRNPVDTAISIWMTDASAPFMADRSNIVFAIRQAFKQADYWRDIIPANRFLDLRYEDLVQDPKKWTQTLLAFCGLPWSEDCLSAEKQSNNVRTPSLWQVRQPIYRSSVARWKRYEPWLGEFRELLELA